MAAPSVVYKERLRMTWSNRFNEFSENFQTASDTPPTLFSETILRFLQRNFSGWSDPLLFLYQKSAKKFFGSEKTPPWPSEVFRKFIKFVRSSHPLSGIPKYVVLTEGRGWGVPCQEQQNCKWQTKKMQGSQAGNFRTHLKTDTKTQNTKLLHFFVSRLFILRSCIEFVNNLVTVASEMLTVTIKFSKIQQCFTQSTKGSHCVPNPQFFNIVQKWRGGGQTHFQIFCCKFCIYN